MKTQGTTSVGTTAVVLAVLGGARCALGFIVSGPPRTAAVSCSKGTWAGAAPLPQVYKLYVCEECGHPTPTWAVEEEKLEFWC